MDSKVFLVKQRKIYNAARSEVPSRYFGHLLQPILGTLLTTLHLHARFKDQPL